MISTVILYCTFTNVKIWTRAVSFHILYIEINLVFIVVTCSLFS